VAFASGIARGVSRDARFFAGFAMADIMPKILQRVKFRAAAPPATGELPKDPARMDALGLIEIADSGTRGGTL
jgi:hypothetical protein